MSEKKWSCKWTRSGRRGRKHKGKEYPRHTLQYYDGEHLGMGKRIWSKSVMHSVWRVGKPDIRDKYIIGLCNKYVGKPYSELKRAYDERMKPFKKYYICGNTLDDFVHNEPVENAWRASFYVDDNGIVRKCKVKPHHRHTLSKRQWDFNKKVKVPSFGQVRQNRKYAANKYLYGLRYRETTYNEIPREFEKPLLLGEFWVNYDNKIFKIPVYTCCAEIFRDYKNYNGWGNTKKHIYIPFHDSNTWHPDRYNWKKKALAVEKEWIPIYVYGLEEGQSYFMRLQNLEKEELTSRINYWKERLLEDITTVERERIQESLNDAQMKLLKMPDIAIYDMGYGKYYTFMKRSDYDNVIKGIARQT